MKVYFLSVLAVLSLWAVYVAAKWLCQRLLEDGHLWRCSLGEELYFKRWRYCYRCQQWVRHSFSRCPGARVACCGRGRS